MRLKHNAVAVELCFTAALLFVFCLVAFFSVIDSIGSSRSSFDLFPLFTLTRVLETLACTVALLVLASHARHGNSRRRQPGLAIAIIGVSLLTLPVVPIPTLARHLLLIVVVALTTALSASRLLEGGPALALWPALKLGAVAPVSFAIGWLPFVIASVGPDEHGYAILAVFAIPLLFSLVALPALLVGFLVRTFGN